MRRLILRAAIWTACVALFLPCLATVTAQAPDARVVAVLADWGRRHKGLAGVKYVLQGEHVFPKGIITHDEYQKPMPFPVPREDTSTPVKRIFLLDLAGGRLRLEIDEQGLSRRRGTYPIQRIDVFDGSTLRILNPEDPNPEVRQWRKLTPDIAEVTGDAEKRTFEEVHWPMFIGLGSVQSVFNRATVKRPITEWDPELLRVHGEAIHQGRRCLVLRTHARGGGAGLFEEYWVDKARQSAVVKYLLVIKRTPEFEIVIDYAMTARGWYPSGWSYTRRDAAKRTVQDLERLRVAQLLFNPGFSTQDFTLENSPGTVAIKTHLRPPDAHASSPEYQIDQQNVYRLTENGTWQEVDKETGEPVAQRQYLLAALLAGVSGVLILWLLGRRAGRMRTQTG